MTQRRSDTLLVNIDFIIEQTLEIMPADKKARFIKSSALPDISIEKCLISEAQVLIMKHYATEKYYDIIPETAKTIGENWKSIEDKLQKHYKHLRKCYLWALHNAKTLRNSEQTPNPPAEKL